MLTFQKTVSSIYKKTYNRFRNYVFLQKIMDRLFPLLVNESKQISLEFTKHLGYKNNINNPKTFNEKIQWLKLNDRTPLHTLCADKLLVRKYIEEQIGESYLIPLQFKTQNISTINSKNQQIKTPCIIKTNHDSGTTFIVKKDLNQKDWNNIQQKLKKSFKRNYYYKSFEWQYKNITPNVIVEELLLDENDKIPNDYKFHCFNGKVEFIQVDIDRADDRRRNLYDTSWTLHNFRIKHRIGNSVKRPKQLNKMIELANVLSSPFCYSRIDFYYVKDKIYFGEITFHPSGGRSKFLPTSYDLYYGKKITLPK